MAMNYSAMPGPGDLYDPDDECGDDGESLEQEDYDEDALDLRAMTQAENLEKHGLEGMQRDVQG